MQKNSDRAFKPVRIAVLTVSDTRKEADDRSGDILVERLKAAGHELTARTIVPDEKVAIRAQVRLWVSDPDIDVIITTGGTGVTGRDVTPEVIESMFSKHLQGFAVIFHMLSFQKIATSTLQSRCTAGVIDTTYVFVLPGSPGACKDAWDGILAYQLDNRHRPCNLVEMMPRLGEI